MMNTPAHTAILDHYRHPRRKGQLANPDVRNRDSNPFCGDEISIDLMIEDDTVVDAAFDGRGCSISQAAASMLMEQTLGRSLEEVRTWDTSFVLDLLGIEVGPIRIKCAQLPLTVLHAGIDGYTRNPSA